MPVSSDSASSGLSARLGRMGKPPPCPKDSSMRSEVGGRERVLPCREALLDAGLERFGFFRLEREVGQDGKAAALSERFVHARRLDAFRVDEAQARAAEEVAAAERQHAERDARDHAVAETFVVHVAEAGDE